MAEPAIIVRAVTAFYTEAVEVRWVDPHGDFLVERYTAPPRETWKARILARAEQMVPPDATEVPKG
jgi:hypothetical protein